MEKTLRRSNRAVRTAAVKRGLEYIYRSACDPENFELYGYDYLCCFQCIEATSKEPNLRSLALKMGRERAIHWRQKHKHIPNHVAGDDLACLMIGSDAADRLGIPDKLFKEQLRKRASDFSAEDLFAFDPANESPPDDIPEICDCGTDNRRGETLCSACGDPLAILSRYAIWLDALIYSYTGERYGIRLGCNYSAVLKWLPLLRRYPQEPDFEDNDFYWSVYAVTHVVYTLNDYGSYQLSPEWLPQEFDFLRRNLSHAMAAEDVESIGEFLDSLKSFGLTESDESFANGVKYLLASQNMDGSWGDLKADDAYQRYHPTWTAIDGLRDYAWRGQRLSFPNLLPILINHRRKEKAPLCVER